MKKFVKLDVNMNMMIKNFETCEIKYKDCKCCFEYTNVKNNLMEQKCLCCNKNYQKAFNKNLKRIMY